MEPNTALAIVPRATSVEVAGSASAALAKATIEAKFVIALQRPRSVMNARAAILDACKRPRFAEGAVYRRKQGKKQDASGRYVDNYVEGLSIRFAEEAVKAWRNVDVSSVTAWEDDEKRVVRITVTDLESNLSYADDVMLAKTVERKKVWEGADVIATRQNSDGKQVFIVRATDEELQVKVNAAKSKAIRNSGLRLIPQDILEEAEEAIRETLAKGGGDPRAEAKKIADAFSAIGVNPSELELFMGHSLDSVTKKELTELRSIYSAIKDGEASWSDYKRKEEDDVPGAEAPKPAPVAPVVVLPAEPPKQSVPTATPQQLLGEFVVGCGFTFDHFKTWARESGNIAKAEDLTGYEDVSAKDAARFLRSKDGLKAQIAAMKGEK